MKKALGLVLLIIIISFGAYACIKATDNPGKPQTSNDTQANKDNARQDNGNFDLSTMPDQTRAAYAFAVENRDMLSKFYCICGCMSPMHEPRHNHLDQCFIKKVVKGRVIYDTHGSTCKACIDEALDVKIWTEKGHEFAQITKLYHQKYGKLQGAPAKWSFK